MKNKNRLIVGTAFSLAAIAVAIDHTRHSLPQPVASQQATQYDDSDESPCGLDGESPCSLDNEESGSPCSLDSSDESPCGLGD